MNQPSLKNNRILIVDDEIDICRLVQGILEDEGYSVSYETSYDAAVKSMSTQEFDLCIFDVWLHDSSEDGILLMQKSLEVSPYTPVIMMSGHSTVETAVQAIKKGAYDFIEKPFKTDRLLVMVKRAIEFFNLKNENQKLKKSGDDTGKSLLSGFGLVSKEFRDLLQKAALAKNAVLIYGELGTGKKTAARYIHQNSVRKEGPCIVHHCHYYNDESDIEVLFKPGGDIEQAHGGTLIFDRVSHMSLTAQKKLLRLIESGGVLGDNRMVDVRIIGTYDLDIMSLVEQGRFLKDLYYLMNVVPIKIPLLRQKTKNIDVLLDGFYKEISGLDKSISGLFSEDAMHALKGYAWPGNLKQLKNFVEWCHIMGLAGLQSIEMSDLPPYLFEGDLRGGNGISNMDPNTSTYNAFFDDCALLPLKEAREKFEKEYLEGQLIRFGFNISKASSHIGMERSALHRKLKSLNVGTSPQTVAANKDDHLGLEPELGMKQEHGLSKISTVKG